MAKYFLAGVYTADVYTKDMSPIMVNGKTLVDSGMTVSTSNEEIRAGSGAQLYGRYFHTSGLTFNITDAMFNLDFIALNTGSLKEVGGYTFAEEQVTATANNSITVKGTPIDFLGKGLVGYVAPVGTDNFSKVTFVGQTAQADVVQGQTYCVKYVANNAGLQRITIPANIVPQECILVLKGDLFLGEDISNMSTATKVGYVETIVPRFQPDGGMDFSLSMTGVAQTPLSGSALVAYDAEMTCGQAGYYARISQVIENENWYDSLTAMAVEDADIQFTATGQTQPIITYGVYEGLTASGVIPSANLTYTLATDTDFEMTGNVLKVKDSASSGANTTLTVSVTGAAGAKAEIVAIANVSYNS